MKDYLIRPLDAAVEPAGFHCGEKPLDEYIQRYASPDVGRNLARVFVAAPAAEPKRPAGFYTLSAGSVACSDLPPAVARKLPRYPVPVALIRAADRRFAVSRQGSGVDLACGCLSKDRRRCSCAGGRRHHCRCQGRLCGSLLSSLWICAAPGQSGSAVVVRYRIPIRLMSWHLRKREVIQAPCALPAVLTTANLASVFTLASSCLTIGRG